MKTINRSLILTTTVLAAVLAPRAAMPEHPDSQSHADAAQASVRIPFDYGLSGGLTVATLSHLPLHVNVDPVQDVWLRERRTQVGLDRGEVGDAMFYGNLATGTFSAYGAATNAWCPGPPECLVPTYDKYYGEGLASVSFKEKITITVQPGFYPEQVDSVLLGHASGFMTSFGDTTSCYSQGSYRITFRGQMAANAVRVDHDGGGAINDLIELRAPLVAAGTTVYEPIVGVAFIEGRVSVWVHARGYLAQGLATAEMTPGIQLVDLWITGLDESRQNEVTWESASGVFLTATPVDSDGDNVYDEIDNCTLVANPDGRDTDGDGIGNACDPDIAPPVNDCAVNFSDLGALKVAFFSAPGDGNWNESADFNSDRSVNFADLATMKSGFFGPPGPSGIPNACEGK